MFKYNCPFISLVSLLGPKLYIVVPIHNHQNPKSPALKTVKNFSSGKKIINLETLIFGIILGKRFRNLKIKYTDVSNLINNSRC